MKSSAVAFAVLLSGVIAAEERTFSTIQPSETAIEAAAATATSYQYPKDNSGYVSGKVFDRIYHVWLENTDYDKAAGQAGMQALAKQGITLSNYWAVTHPSEPNYMASAAGDYFGLGDDSFVTLPETVFSIADLLDSKGISWAEYQEHSPYTGYQGFEYLNQETEANDYVRKHNPLILFDRVVNDATSLSKIKNFTEFDVDYKNKQLPQWAFITPNMTNDGHDTSIEVSGNWAKAWLSPLLNDTFFTDRTLVVLTFDENDTYEIPNKVMAILLGDIPDSLKGTTDDTFYDHYSLLSTAEANWELPNLGRNDCGANVLKIVADEVGYTNKAVDTTGMYNNQSAPGYFSDDTLSIPAPNLTCQGAGGSVYSEIVKAWSK